MRNIALPNFKNTALFQDVIEHFVENHDVNSYCKDIIFMTHKDYRLVCKCGKYWSLWTYKYDSNYLIKFIDCVNDPDFLNEIVSCRKKYKEKEQNNIRLHETILSLDI